MWQLSGALKTMVWFLSYSVANMSQKLNMSPFAARILTNAYPPLCVAAVLLEQPGESPPVCILL